MAKTKTKTKKKPANRVNGDKVPRAQHSVPRHTTAFLNMVDKAQKAQSDKMIFFRIEDEYDLFFEDAEKAEHILGLRVKGELGVTYTSFPAREYETNLGLLLRAGQRVAVCETGGEPVEVVDPVESPVPETAAAIDQVVNAAKAGPLTPEELAAYDAETLRMASEAEAKVGTAESIYEDLKSEAASAKKHFEAKQDELRRIIRDRAENRGKRPKPEQPTLMDVLPKWKSLPLSAMELPEDLAGRLAKHASDLQAVDEVVNSDGEPWEESDSTHFGITLNEVAIIREKLKAVIEKESPTPAAESDLYKSYPIDLWTKFGLTKKDVERLHACETKGHATGFPIVTMGDLQRFITPNPASPGYAQSVKDIKGIGDAGSDRLGEAELQFWGWWRAGGEAEYAAELEAAKSPTGTPVAEGEAA